MFVIDKFYGVDSIDGVHYFYMLEKSTGGQRPEKSAWKNFHEAMVEESEVESSETSLVADTTISQKPLRLMTADDERRRKEEVDIERLKKDLSLVADMPEDRPEQINVEALSEKLNVMREDIRRKYGIDVIASSPSFFARARVGMKKLANADMRQAIKEYNDARELKTAAERRRLIVESALKSGVPKPGPRPPLEATM